MHRLWLSGVMAVDVDDHGISISWLSGEIDAAAVARNLTCIL